MKKEKAILQGLINMKNFDVPVAEFDKHGNNDVIERFIEK